MICKGRKAQTNQKTKPRVKGCSANTGFGCKSRNWDLRIHFLWSSTWLRLNKKAPCVNSAKIQIFPKHFSNHLLQSFKKMPKTFQTWFNVWSSSHSSINQVSSPQHPTSDILLIKKLSKEESCTADSKSFYSVRNKCHGMNTAWNTKLCLHTGSQRIPSWLKNQSFNLWVRKGRSWEIWIRCHMESPISPKSVFRDWEGYRQPGQAAPWQHWHNHEGINMARDAQWEFNRTPTEFSSVSLLLDQAS